MVAIPARSAAESHAGRLAAPLPWLALFGLAVAVRALLFPFVFVDGEVRFPAAADEFYHLRRIWFTVVRFPEMLDFDRYVNFPLGARPPWPPAFDWSIAALARLLVGPEQQTRVEAVAVWVPPLLGALTVLAVAWLARRHFGRTAGWLSGLLLAVLPVHVLYSELSVVDHHVAVALLAVALVGAAMQLAEPAEKAPRRSAVALTGVSMAALLLLWPGGLLDVVVVQAVLVGQALLVPVRALARTRARALAALHALAAVLVAPFCLGQEWAQYGRLSPLVLSAFQPLWLACGAAALWLASALWGWDRCGASRSRRIATALALGAAGLALAWIAVPGLAEEVRNAAGWFRADPFMEDIAELRPLLFPAGRFEPAGGYVPYSHLFWIYPLAAGWLLWKARAEGRSDVPVLVLWSAAFLLTALTQRRFNDSAAPGFAIVMGSALAQVGRVISVRLPPARRHWVPLGAAVLLALALLPSLRELGRIGRASLLLLRGVAVAETEGANLRWDDLLERVANWLREASPPTRGYLDPRLEPEYGILSAWDHGHLLRYYAERPLVEDNFGPFAGRAGFDAARQYFTSAGEEEALAVADRCRARYVVATAAGSGQAVATRGTMAERLALRLDRRGQLVLPAAALARHRLVFVAEDRARALPAGRAPQIVALYEIVAGARVSGRAPSGATVRFDLPLRLPDGTLLAYDARARTDADGRYEIRLPYPTRDVAPLALRSAASYRVRVGERDARLELTEADVREGLDVAGPSFEP